MMNDQQPIIEARNLTRRFGSLIAVDRLNLEVARGEIFGLVGPDGAGKTTTLRLLCGLLRPSEGQVWIAGYELLGQPDAVKEHIGYMPQRFGLYDDLTVDENMRFYADLFGLPSNERETFARQLLKMTRMEPFRRRRAAHLSGGMKQKLALMCTLLHRPTILLLDEPTSGVDPVSRRDFWVILYELVKEGLTVLVTTSYLDEAERCNRIGLIYQGRLIYCASPERLKQAVSELCYEVSGPDQRAAREVLQSCDGVLSVEPAGAVLHLFLSPARTSVAILEQQLSRHGLGLFQFKPLVPSLEDVFIALVRKAVTS